MDGDLMAIGKCCAVGHCAMLDFLPFKCDCCHQTYCLEHRTYSAHSCSKSNGKALDVIVCPLCAKGIHLRPSDDPNAVFERHTVQECDPANYNRVHRKPRCPVHGCKEKLTTINQYTCKTCGQRVCLKHRLEMDHNCSAGRAAAAASSRQTGTASSATAAAAAAVAAAAAAGRSLGSCASSLLSDLRGTAVAAPSAPAAGNQSVQQQWPRPAAASPEVIDLTEDNSVRGTAARRRRMLGVGAPASASASPTGVTAVSDAAAGVGGTAAEQCPQCGAAFANLRDLIAHVEGQHGNGSSGSSSQQRPHAGEQFACPVCAAMFSDAVLLVAHSQQCGGRPAASRPQGQCVLS